MIINKIVEYLAPHWFKLFIIGVILGAFLAHIQKLSKV